MNLKSLRRYMLFTVISVFLLNTSLWVMSLMYLNKIPIGVYIFCAVIYTVTYIMYWATPSKKEIRQKDFFDKNNRSVADQMDAIEASQKTPWLN